MSFPSPYGAAPAAPRSLPRRSADGRYVLLRVLGEGAAAVVYEALDAASSRQVGLGCVTDCLRGPGRGGQDERPLARYASWRAQLSRGQLPDRAELRATRQHSTPCPPPPYHHTHAHRSHSRCCVSRWQTRKTLAAAVLSSVFTQSLAPHAAAASAAPRQPASRQRMSMVGGCVCVHGGC